MKPESGGSVEQPGPELGSVQQKRAPARSAARNSSLRSMPGQRIRLL